MKQMQRILDEPDRYQLLCANCNYIKRYENDEAHRNQEVEETVGDFIQAALEKVQ